MENKIKAVSAQLLPECLLQLRVLLDAGSYAPGSSALDDYLGHKNSDHVFFMWQEEGRVAGIILGRFVFDTADLDYIAVGNDFCGTGIASNLLNHFCESATLAACERVVLEVGVQNKRAIAFYLKQGFRHISVRKNYYSHAEDALILEKFLDRGRT